MILNNEFSMSSSAQDAFNVWTLDFLSKADIIRAVAEHSVHFVVFSPLPHDWNQWASRYDYEN